MDATRTESRSVINAAAFRKSQSRIRESSPPQRFICIAMELFAFISHLWILGKLQMTFTKKLFLGQPSGLSSSSFSSGAGNGLGPRRRILAKKRINSKRRKLVCAASWVSRRHFANFAVFAANRRQAVPAKFNAFLARYAPMPLRLVQASACERLRAKDKRHNLYRAVS